MRLLNTKLLLTLLFKRVLPASSIYWFENRIINGLKQIKREIIQIKFWATFTLVISNCFVHSPLKDTNNYKTDALCCQSSYQKYGIFHKFWRSSIIMVTNKTKSFATRYRLKFQVFTKERKILHLQSPGNLNWYITWEWKWIYGLKI